MVFVLVFSFTLLVSAFLSESPNLESAQDQPVVTHV